MDLWILCLGVYRPLTSQQHGQICQIAQFKQNIRGKKKHSNRIIYLCNIFLKLQFNSNLSFKQYKLSCFACWLKLEFVNFEFKKCATVNMSNFLTVNFSEKFAKIVILGKFDLPT